MATSAAYVGTGANNNDGGNLGWTNPTNFQGDTTGTAATISLATNGHISQQLRGTAFGFAIPADATINGVQIDIEAGSANNNRQAWHTVQLLKAGTAAGSNLSDATGINAKAIKTFGSASEMWGTTLSPTDVNNSGFGVLIKVTRTAAQATTTSMYRAQITVTYSLPATFSGVTMTHMQIVGGFL